MYERFTDRARKAMQLANQEAQRWRHEYIGVEHMLLGLVKEGGGVAANVLKNLGVDLRKLRLEMERVMEPGPDGDSVVMGRLPHTPRLKKAIEHTVAAARELEHNYIGTEHLLLGILADPEGVATKVLVGMGVSTEKVISGIHELLKGRKPVESGEQGFVHWHLPPAVAAMRLYECNSVAIQVGNVRIEGEHPRFKVWIDGVEQKHLQAVTLTMGIRDVPKLILQSVILPGAKPEEPVVILEQTK